MSLPTPNDILSWPESDSRVVTLRVAARFMQYSAARDRVASRYMRIAFQFPNEKALREYLKEHPNADKSNHSVEKPHGDKDKGQDDGGEEKPKPTWKERLKSLSDKARAFVKGAPKAVQKFIQDPEHRRAALLDAHKTLTEAPEKIVKRVLNTVKHEVHEWKEAGAGIKAVLTGKKMSKGQKAAVKTVAFHIALTAAASVLTASGGPLVAAGAFGKSLVKHVAMKAASSALGHIHVLQELGHVGHGIVHILEKFAADKKAPDADTAMVNLALAALAKELGKLDDEDSIAETLEAMEE